MGPGSGVTGVAWSGQLPGSVVQGEPEGEERAIHGCRSPAAAPPEGGASGGAASGCHGTNVIWTSGAISMMPLGV